MILRALGRFCFGKSRRCGDKRHTRRERALVERVRRVYVGRIGPTESGWHGACLSAGRFAARGVWPEPRVKCRHMREPRTFRFRQAQSGRFGRRPNSNRAGARPAQRVREPRARFLEGRAKTLSVLEVDFPLASHAPDRLRRALFALRIQVIAEIRQQIGGTGRPLAACRRVRWRSNQRIAWFRAAAPI